MLSTKPLEHVHLHQTAQECFQPNASRAYWSNQTTQNYIKNLIT
jgi:hypothetical protein